MPITRASRVISSTGASARRLIQYPPNQASTSTTGVDHSNSIRTRLNVASVASIGVATRMRYDSPFTDTVDENVRYCPDGRTCTPKADVEFPASNDTVLLAIICWP